MMSLPFVCALDIADYKISHPNAEANREVILRILLSFHGQYPLTPLLDTIIHMLLAA